MTPEEHYVQGERWLREAERWESSGLAQWRAAIAQAHFTAALYRPPAEPQRTEETTDA